MTGRKYAPDVPEKTGVGAPWSRTARWLRPSSGDAEAINRVADWCRHRLLGGGAVARWLWVQRARAHRQRRWTLGGSRVDATARRLDGVGRRTRCGYRRDE